MRICIATGRYYEAGETQVNHHIEKLFAGDTIVLTRRSNGKDPFGKPLHVWHQRATGTKAVAHHAAVALQMLRQRGTKVTSDAEAKGIVTFLQDHKADVMLAEFGHHALPVYRAAIAANVPFFVYFRGADASKHLRKFTRAASYRKMIAEAAGVFAVSQFLLDELAARGISHPVSHVIPSGVDTSVVRPDEKVAGRYIYVGRFVPKKQPLLALDAFAQVATTNPQARLRMIGTGALLGACRARVTALGLDARVTFLEQLDHAAVHAEMAVAQVLLLPSRRAKNGDTEGLPMVVQEAMAAGTIVVSTDHAGIPEAVQDGVTGLLASEDDPAAFCAALRAAATLDDQQIAQMSRLAREVAVERLDRRLLLSKVQSSIKAALGT